MLEWLLLFLGIIKELSSFMRWLNDKNVSRSELFLRTPLRKVDKLSLHLFIFPLMFYFRNIQFKAYQVVLVNWVNQVDLWKANKLVSNRLKSSYQNNTLLFRKDSILLGILIWTNYYEKLPTYSIQQSNEVS